MPGGASTCAKPGTGAGECGAGIPAGTKLAFNVIYASDPVILAEASYLTQQQPSLFQPNYDLIAVWKDNVSGRPAAIEAMTQYGLNTELMYLTG